MGKEVVHIMYSLFDYKLKWGKVRMCSDFTLNKRPAYYNNEIVSLFKNTVEKNEDSVEKVALKCNSDIKTINLMLTGNIFYSYGMLKNVSRYTNVPFEKLTEILVDDNKFNCRGLTDENTKDLTDIINYIFDEMIKQERLIKC